MAKYFLIEGRSVELADMIAANSQDQGVVEWLENAKIGDVFNEGTTVVCLGEEINYG